LLFIASPFVADKRTYVFSSYAVFAASWTSIGLRFLILKVLVCLGLCILDSGALISYIHTHTHTHTHNTQTHAYRLLQQWTEGQQRVPSGSLVKLLTSQGITKTEIAHA